MIKKVKEKALKSVEGYTYNSKRYRESKLYVYRCIIRHKTDHPLISGLTYKLEDFSGDKTRQAGRVNVPTLTANIFALDTNRANIHNKTLYKLSR